MTAERVSPAASPEFSAADVGLAIFQAEAELSEARRNLEGAEIELKNAQEDRHGDFEKREKLRVQKADECRQKVAVLERELEVLREELKRVS